MHMQVLLLHKCQTNAARQLLVPSTNVLTFTALLKATTDQTTWPANLQLYKSCMFLYQVLVVCFWFLRDIYE